MKINLDKMPIEDRGSYLLTGRLELAKIARYAADRVLDNGVAQVIVSATETGGVVMRARGGSFTSAVREGAQSLSVRVFDGGRTGVATSSALNHEAIDLAVKQALVIARQVEPDADIAFPEADWLGRDLPKIELFDPVRISPEDLGRTALEIEAAAVNCGAGTIRVLEAGASTIDACAALAIGRDFDRSLLASRHDRWCAAIAEKDGLMTQDWWSASDRRPSNLLPSSEIGILAAQRAMRKSDARTLASRTAPVIFDSVIAPILVEELTSALTGQAQFEKATFLKAGKGYQALASHLDLIEDPFEPFGLASGACDSEGVAGKRRHIIRGGVVEDFFLSCLYAKKLGLKSTGNADGVRNLRLVTHMAALSLDRLIREMHQGLWVTEVIGGNFDPVSGAYSKAVTGFWIENGQIAFPVQDITIAGELPLMLKQIVAVGSDVYRSGAVRTGSLLVESMRISGR